MSGLTLTTADLDRLGLKHQGGQIVRKPTKRERATLIPSPYKSKWEADRARVLEVSRVTGGIRDWRYEAIRLRLADGAWYKPDFMIWHTDASVECEEVKGHWREAARVRWKVAVEQYPMFAFSLWTKERGLWCRVELHNARI